ncbi:MAG TPA: ATP-binding protein [Terriglobales bacterium]|nr:ATP-binding protein [Terriglobales bacterium]
MAAPSTAECALCHGSGWRTAEGPGKRVRRCDCQLQGRVARLLAQARIPARYQHCELADYDPNFSGANSSLASARLAAGRFVEEYPVEKTGLLFTGSIGVGKTHLAVGIARELIVGKGVPCLFCDYRELLKEIQNSYNPSVSATEMSILRPVFEAEVLVLDELGAVKPTEWVWDTVSLVLNTRYNDVRTTIITTNLPDQPAAGAVRESHGRGPRDETLGDRIGERMRSRLHEMCRKVEMTGEDFRQKVKSGSFR